MIEFLFTKTPLAYFVASFWRDEAFSYLMARLPLSTLLWSTAKDANPPFYYVLLKLWMDIFGTSEIAIRSLSLVFFWATLYVVFLIMNEIYKINTKKSLYYLLFFILNPLLHYYAFEARMYSMMAFMATLLFYALMKKKYKLYAYAALAALFTHYFLIIVIAFQSVFILLTSLKTERKHFFLPLVKACLWYIPWVIVLVFAHPPVGTSFWLGPPQIKDILLLPAIILIGYEKDAWTIAPFLFFFSLFSGAILIFGSLHHFFLKKKQQLFLFLGWSLGIPLVIFIFSFIKPMFLPRYLIFTTIGLSLLLVSCFEHIGNRWVRSVLTVIFIVFLVFYTSIQAVIRTKAPLKKEFLKIQNEMKNTDVIYVTHEYDFHPAEYYFSTQKVYLYKKTYAEIPWFVGKVLMDKRSFKDTLPQYPVRAFIINHDGTYTIQSRQ